LRPIGTSTSLSRVTNYCEQVLPPPLFFFVIFEFFLFLGTSRFFPTSREAVFQPIENTNAAFLPPPPLLLSCLHGEGLFWIDFFCFSRKPVILFRALVVPPFPFSLEHFLCFFSRRHYTDFRHPPSVALPPNRGLLSTWKPGSSSLRFFFAGGFFSDTAFRSAIRSAYGTGSFVSPFPMARVYTLFFRYFSTSSCGSQLGRRSIGFR